MELLHEAQPCPFGLEPPDCPHGAYVYDLNRASGWEYRCRRLGDQKHSSTNLRPSR